MQLVSQRGFATEQGVPKQESRESDKSQGAVPGRQDGGGFHGAAPGLRLGSMGQQAPGAAP